MQTQTTTKNPTHNEPCQWQINRKWLGGIFIIWFIFAFGFLIKFMYG